MVMSKMLTEPDVVSVDVMRIPGVGPCRWHEENVSNGIVSVHDVRVSWFKVPVNVAAWLLFAEAWTCAVVHVMLPRAVVNVAVPDEVFLKVTVPVAKGTLPGSVFKVVADAVPTEARLSAAVAATRAVFLRDMRSSWGCL
jgi:hypothetical protein